MVLFHIFDCLRPRKLEDGIYGHEVLGKEDRISELPNDILVHIVSLLPQKEAARTCILSKHWQEIQLFCGRFDFDSEAILGIPKKRTYGVSKECRSEEKRKYIEWVNKVVRSSDDATAIDEFRVQFDLDNSSREEMDEWMSCAFARKVKKLELNLRSELVECMFGNEKCVLDRIKDSLFLSSNHPVVECNINYGFPRRLLLNQSSWFLIRSLILIQVSVCGEDVKVFLQTFRFLEFLEISQSPTLTRVEVYGPSLVLKHLSITRYGNGPSCHSFPSTGHGSIIIRDTQSLVSLESDFWYMDNLEVENAPNLVHARLPGFGWFIDKVSQFDPTGHYVYILANMQVLPDHPALFSRLQLLTLDVVSLYFHLRKVTHVPTQLTQLKQLNLNVLEVQDLCQSFTYLTSLIRECPKLEKLVLKLQRWRGETDVTIRETESEPIQGLNFRLRHLKIVEFHEYPGRSTDDEFVRFLLENAADLHTISIHPHQGMVRRAADRLKRSVNRAFPSVEFLII